MIGASDEAATVKRIFNFPEGADDILILGDEGIETPADLIGYDPFARTGVADARKWLLNSRLTIGLV